jgi:ATP-binding cassette subfamily A (ABC1) protein 3
MNNDNWQTSTLFSLLRTLGPREKNENEGGKPGYYREGFLHIQKAIDYALIKHLTNINVDSIIDLNFKRYPFPPYQDDNFVIVVIAFLPFVILVSFIFTSILTAKAIVHEKETGMKEAMKLMGMKAWIYWLSWYIRSLLLLIPGIIMMTISFKVKLDLNSGGTAAIINKTDAFIFILVLILYASSNTTFTFLTTCFFKKANAAAAGAGVLQFLTYLPFVFFSIKFDIMGYGEKIASSFINNVCMGYGIQMIGMFEAKGVGVNFDNWTKGLTLQDTYSMGHVILILFFNNFIHLILLYYFENVFPGDHGIARSWYFPIKFLIRNRKKIFTDIELKNTKIEELDDNFVEDESIYSDYKIGIKIENITKSFKQLGTVKHAVKDLSLNIYQGQISVLLGHNGAGKLIF